MTPLAESGSPGHLGGRRGPKAKTKEKKGKKKKNEKIKNIRKSCPTNFFKMENNVSYVTTYRSKQ